MFPIKMLEFKKKTLDQMVEHAIRGYPNEACGLLLGIKGKDSVDEFVAMKNIYDVMHAKDSETYPRTAKTAYLIDPREQQALFDAAEKNGREVKAIFHSHTDHDAYFSEEDRLVAAPWGEPMFPGVSYVVASIWDGTLKALNEFYWDASINGFQEHKII